MGRAATLYRCFVTPDGSLVACPELTTRVQAIETAARAGIPHDRLKAATERLAAVHIQESLAERRVS